MEYPATRRRPDQQADPGRSGDLLLHLDLERVPEGGSATPCRARPPSDRPHRTACGCLSARHQLLDALPRGFHDAVAAAGLDAVVHSCEPSFEGARECLRQIDAEQPGTTGLIVHNEAALGPLLSALRATQREIPDDVSVVAVCPEDVAVSMPVALTSIDIPAHEVGSLAVELVMKLLDGPRRAQARLLSPTL